MQNQASERLNRLIPQIMKTWESRALGEVAAAMHQESLALRNSLPEFLRQIVEALSTTVERTQVKIKWDLEESTRVGRKHGQVRAITLNYTMDQLVFEYHILRQVMCEAMDVEVALSPIEREIIVCAVEQAVNDAASEFSQTLSDIQTTLTQTLAHDLRGPITASKIGAQLLLKKPSDPDHCVKIASRISLSMDRLDLMIHDLLDASRLRAGEKINLTLEECDLDIILSIIVDEANFLNGNRFHYKSNGPLLGNWNENGLKRVFDNLITNAVKFSTPETEIKIKVKVSDETIEVSVHNFGPTISDKEKSILFQQYRRVKSSHGQPGWGLGLTVVKGITEALKGAVSVESSPEEGTTFLVNLPFQKNLKYEENVEAIFTEMHH